MATVCTGGAILARMRRTGVRLAMVALCLAMLPALLLADPPGVVQLSPSLRQLAAARHLLFGTAVRVPALELDGQYGSVLADQYDAVTPENAMKWDTIQPGPHTYDFRAGDAVVSFARSHHMVVRGHNLVWHEQNPAWLTSRSWTRDQLIALLRGHIMTVVGHYRGEVAQWDVVNEAIGDDGTLRRNIWLDGIGPDYIAMAFRWAHQADPAAELFYNDYGLELGGPRTQAAYDLVSRLRSRGVPVHGVGLQFHEPVTTADRLAAVPGVMARFDALGLDVAVTELDVWLPQGPSGRPLARSLEAQAGYYRTVLDDCLAAARCSTFATWGFTDRYSWVPGRFPGYSQALPFDVSYHPKPAAYALQQALAAAAG
ncbi:MAG TPA: endo-1,4-beta-xylanase [Acidimicrobiales bacterium]|nr:endo-1,4-beta-xylanase [Acidimicrobiales bacterium]